MIAGIPHQEEDSFFNLAMERLRKETAHHIDASTFTLGGFPVTRARKHVARGGLAAKPDIVVMQFASSDLVVPIRRQRRRDGSIGPRAAELSVSPPRAADRLRWRAQGLVGDVLRLTPVTPPELYLETMTHMARTFLEHRVVPVVLSPFVFGGGRSNRIARDCAGRLKQALDTVPRAVYVDAYAALSRHTRWRMLLSDGSHLSLEGHQVVAAALFARLKELLRKPGWLREKDAHQQSHSSENPEAERAVVPSIVEAVAPG